MSAQVASLQLNVEHLKKQSEMDRIKVSEASKEYVDHINECTDTIINVNVLN